MTCTLAFILGSVLTAVGCATIAGYIWLKKTGAWDHEPTGEELKAKVGEVYYDFKN